MKEGHESVLLHEAVVGLNLSEGDVVIDATLGLGGHSAEIARIVGKRGVVLGIDADSQSLQKAEARLRDAPATMRYALGNFRDINAHAHAAGITHAQGVLFDLGWNASQLAAGRGFSFHASDPLVMTYASKPDTTTAATVVNTWREEDLKEILRTLGEERYAGRIASAIVTARKDAPIARADELAGIVEHAVPAAYRRRKTHPATKTFQALRMVVNGELASLEAALPKALALLAPHGRLAVITFHSLEDGLVKRIFRRFANEGTATLITKKPVAPTREAVRQNPRARSAKLRIIEKT